MAFEYDQARVAWAINSTTLAIIKDDCQSQCRWDFANRKSVCVSASSYVIGLIGAVVEVAINEFDLPPLELHKKRHGYPR